MGDTDQIEDGDAVFEEAAATDATPVDQPVPYVAEDEATSIPMRLPNGDCGAFPLDDAGNSLVPLADIETAQAHGFVVVAD